MTLPETVDVVVVGGGNAGLMAALEAAGAGAEVLVLQKLPEAGGKSSLAIGSISAAGTSLQRARDIDDDHDRHWSDLLARIAAGGVEPLSMQRLELAVRHGAAAVERLVELGVRFTGPHPELPGERWRMHVIAPDARALVTALATAATAAGVEVRGDWTVDELVVSDGCVVGVRGARGVVHARRAVVLASGDFSAPGRLADVVPEGSRFAFRPWASGDGQLMAGAAGAELTHVDRPLRVQLRTTGWPHIEPSAALFTAGAILVDRSGTRLVDERDQPAAALAARHPDAEVFLVGGAGVLDRIPTAADDSAHARDAWLGGGLYIATFPGVAYAYAADVVAAGYGVAADSLGEVASRLGLDAAGLARHALAGPFLGVGPFRVAAILGRAGIRTDDALRVLDAEGAPIPGLLAAGAAAGVTGFAYGHGYELAWAVVSGRIAGATAATHDESLEWVS